jgi:hypothetical protein
MTLSDRVPLVPFTCREAKQLGLSNKRLRSAVIDGTIVRVLRGVYLLAGVELTTLVRAQAAALVTNSGMVVCDRTAAWIHGAETHDYWELDVVVPLEVCVLRGKAPTERSECAGGTRDLHRDDWMLIGGVRVTTPMRTAMDLGCKLSRRGALAAMDSLMRIHGFTTSELRSVVPRYFRRRGVIQLRQLIPVVDGRSESPAESWTRLEILDQGLPMPTPQHWVVVNGVPTYRLDLAYPHARVAVEYDGEEFHTSEEDRLADARRRAWLREQGWTVIVLDKRSFAADAAAEWIRELRAALRMAL